MASTASGSRRPEGDKNQDPARLRLTVIDPKPAFRTFDLAYDYPAYLRFKPMTAMDVREPEIEAPRGTQGRHHREDDSRRARTPSWNWRV